MSSALIRTAIAAILSTVPDVGAVHEFERHAKNENELKALYMSPDLNIIRGWFVRREAQQTVGLHHDRDVRVIKWVLMGWSVFDDKTASEVAFDSLIDQIIDTFKADDTLGGTVAQCSEPVADGLAGIQVEDQGPVQFAGVLCHAARLTLTTVNYT